MMIKTFRTAFLFSVALLSFLLSPSSYALQEGSKEEPSSQTERIEVYGQRPLFLIKKEIDRMEVSFYKLYNKLNKKSKYDMVCKPEKDLGTNITRTVCEPRYMKTVRAQLTRDSGLSANVSAQEVELAARSETAEATRILVDLIQNNAELRERYVGLNKMVADYQQRKAAGE